MALKPVGRGNRTYVNFKDCVEGQILAEGNYMGTIDGKYGPQHLVRKADGDEVVVNNSGHLDYLIKTNIEKGDFIQIRYDGKTELTKGKYAGKLSHQFIVLKDDSASSSTAGAEIVNMEPTPNKAAKNTQAQQVKSAAQELLDSDDDSEEDLDDADAIIAKYRA